jgi:hypothetical protein
MNTATATTRRQLTAAECWLEVETRRICLVPVFTDKLWAASVEVKGRGPNRSRTVRALSAVASTSTGAVAALVSKLEAEEAVDIVRRAANVPMPPAQPGHRLQSLPKNFQGSGLTQ